MSETQTQKHEFPENWHKIPETEVVEHIKYLLNHYKEYDIKRDGSSLVINNNITIFLDNFSITGPFSGIAGLFYWENTEIYPLVKELLNLCEVEVNKREQQAKKQAEIKANKKKRIIFTVISFAFIIATIAGTVYMINDIFKIIDKERAKQNKIENEIKKYEKTLPYYNEYLQTKQQIQNRRDSLEKVY